MAGYSGPPPVQENPPAMSQSNVTVISLADGSTSVEPTDGEVASILGTPSFAGDASDDFRLDCASVNVSSPRPMNNATASAVPRLSFLYLAIILILSFIWLLLSTVPARLGAQDEHPKPSNNLIMVRP